MMPRISRRDRKEEEEPAFKIPTDAEIIASIHGASGTGDVYAAAAAVEDLDVAELYSPEVILRQAQEGAQMILWYLCAHSERPDMARHVNSSCWFP